VSLIANLGTSKVVGLLRGAAGLQASVTAAAEAMGAAPIALSDSQIVASNVAADLMEQSTAYRYPAVHVYCERTVNALREKSRRFSGSASMVIEVRTTSDRVDGLDPSATVMVNGVTQILDQNRGDLGDGMFYGGAYQISYGPVKHGGKNFLQTAKVSFDFEISSN